jgi:branched-chain amino acid transport system ATP-binding protein
MNLLEIKNLSVRFGGLLAIEDLSFEVREGEVLSLIGPNGAGKTTAFNAITGYLAPASGEIVFQNRRINNLKSHQVAALGLVRTFQKTSVFAGRSALDNVLTGLHLRAKQTPLAILLGLPYVAREEIELRAEAERILVFAGVRKNEIAGSLPYGEQRLLEVAIALAAQPRLLLLDEPVSGMNPSETAAFMAKLGEIRALGITVLLVEHDMKMVMGVSDRVVCLSQGRIIAGGTPAEIQANPEVIKAYLGERYKHARR